MKHAAIKLGNEKTVTLSASKHNEIQAAIINEFVPQFVKDGEVLYVGDITNKGTHLDKKILRELKIPIDMNSKLPDVVIYDRKNNWIFLIETIASHGPVSPKRRIELEESFKDCKAGRIYVTVFPDLLEFSNHSDNIAWETNVWAVDSPSHMIHFNGNKFIRPR